MPDSNQQPAPPAKRPGNEEPQITNEDSVPLDGKDPVGEKMMDELGKDRRRNDEQPAEKATEDKVPPQPHADPLPKRMPIS
ncbi:conserved hypothetical protein [Burkholderiales bacterium 8X]|nr:conserved hypothetical protein [Burkholderiales bacterium 8X]